MQNLCDVVDKKQDKMSQEQHNEQESVLFYNKQ